MSDATPREAVTDLLLTEYGRAPYDVVEHILSHTSSNAVSYERLMDNAVRRAAARVRNEVREGLRVSLTALLNSDGLEDDRVIDSWIESTLKEVGL